MSDTSLEILESHQLKLEQLYSKNQLLPRIKREFLECDSYDFIGHIEASDLSQEFGLDLLAQMALHKRANLPTMVGVLMKHFMSQENPAQATADALYRAADTELVYWYTDLEKFVVRFTISDEVQEELDRFQYPLPMVIEPKKVKKNTDTGYLLGKGSLILRNNHHDDDICLDHINRMNRVRLSINTDTAEMAKNSWKNLDKPKEGETKDEFNQRKRAFEKYRCVSKDVIDMLTEHSDSFYLTHKYDKRGRTYCQGYHVDYQGYSWNKAVVCLADKELVE